MARIFLKDSNIEITKYVDHIIYKIQGNNTAKLYLKELPEYDLINQEAYEILTDNSIYPAYKIVAVEIV